MITSMTGFARREAAGLWGTLVCELRSVNHRFLEAGFRLPDELRAIEPDLRQSLMRELKRGKVDCTISLRAAHGAHSALELDADALASLVARVRELANAFPAHHTVNLLDVLRWPGVIRDFSSAGEEMQSTARALVVATLTELVAARVREGERLRELIEQRCTGLAALVAQVRLRLPAVQLRVRGRLNERLAELVAQIDKERLEQELASR